MSDGGGSLLTHVPAHPRAQVNKEKDQRNLSHVVARWADSAADKGPHAVRCEPGGKVECSQQDGKWPSVAANHSETERNRRTAAATDI